MAYKIETTWTCDVLNCREYETETQRGDFHPEGAPVNFDPIPVGWSWVDGKLICDKHVILIHSGHMQVVHVGQQVEAEMKGSIITN